MNKWLTFRCASIALTALACGSVLADAPADPAQVVSYRDLNLKSPDGVAALYRRIERAADAVCQLPRGTLQLKIETELKACKASATDRAVVQARLPALNALHLAKTGRTVDEPRYTARR